MAGFRSPMPPRNPMGDKDRSPTPEGYPDLPRIAPPIDTGEETKSAWGKFRKTPKLHPGPDPVASYYERFEEVLDNVHLRTASYIAERQVQDLLEEARETGKTEAAERWALALDALRDGREALK